MKSFHFKKIDAFTKGEASGNPAGVVYLDQTDEINSEEMQKIAAELKGFVSEVGFVRQTGASEFTLKYFSSEREVDFCGHATIAILYDLLSGREDLCSKDVVHISNNKGTLAVYNRIEAEDAVFISAPLPVFSNKVVPVKEIAAALRTDIGSIDGGLPATIVNAGLETLIVPIARLDDILALKPDLDQLKEFCTSNSIDIITVFCKETADAGNQFRTRVYAPTFGYLEDPATGSGNSAFGYYLGKNGLIPGKTISIEQNGFRNAANTVKLEFSENKDGALQVLFGGNAVTRISGMYYLV